jgi:myosin-crossreactive antigen
MTLDKFLRSEYQKQNFWYVNVVVRAFKKYNYKISVKQIRRELNKIIKES